MIVRNIIIGSLLSAALIVTGCKEEPKVTRSGAVRTATNSKQPPPKPSPKQREVRDLFKVKSKVLEYAYNPIGKRDPFKEVSGTAKLTQLDRGGPLTSYDIDQMQLVAVIWGIAEPRGLIQLPDGKSYIIKRNTSIGRHFGKIARITPTSVIVEEEFRGPLGDLQIKETKMILHKDDKDQQLSAGFSQ
jgi:type IV pilus assembly protein PilP